MKKIVMLNCLRANSVCTGAACLQKVADRLAAEGVVLVDGTH